MGREFDDSIASGECNCSCSWDVHKLHDHECKSTVEAAGGERLEAKFFVLVFAAMPSSTMDERMALIEEEKEVNYSKIVFVSLRYFLAAVERCRHHARYSIASTLGERSARPVAPERTNV